MCACVSQVPGARRPSESSAGRGKPTAKLALFCVRTPMSPTEQACSRVLRRSMFHPPPSVWRHSPMQVNPWRLVRTLQGRYAPPLYSFVHGVPHSIPARSPSSR